MNNQRRKELDAISARIDELKSLAEEIKGDLESVRDDEQDYFDNMPESLQGGEKGERAQTAVDLLDEMISDLEDFAGRDFESDIDTVKE